MPADTTVKFFHSAMTGAPVLSGTAGALKAVLDAVLLNGWGSATLDSLVIAGGIATATRAAGHPFEIDSVAQISGAVTTGGSVNGERRVLNVSGTSYTFDATGLPDQTATGSITHRVAPLGWTSPFVAGNLAVYRTAGGAQGFLRVDDTGAQDARVRGFETMTDVNTGTEPFPTVEQVPGGLFWSKSEAASSAARAWMAWGDARTLYIALACTGFNQSAFNTHSFGDFRSYAASDPYAALITGLAASNGNSSMPRRFADVFSSATEGSQAAYAMRVGAGLAGSAQLRRVAPHAPLSNTASLMSGEGNAAHYTYPNPATGGLLLMPLLMLDPGPGNALRGVCRGVYYCPQWVGMGQFSNRQYVGDLPDLPDRKLRVVLNGSGPGFVDGTGPWA